VPPGVLSRTFSSMGLVELVSAGAELGVEDLGGGRPGGGAYLG
jgi:hypothetical protein